MTFRLVHDFLFPYLCDRSVSPNGWALTSAMVWEDGGSNPPRSELTNFPFLQFEAGLIIYLVYLSITRPLFGQMFLFFYFRDQYLRTIYHQISSKDTEHLSLKLELVLLYTVYLMYFPIVIDSALCCRLLGHKIGTTS